MAKDGIRSVNGSVYRESIHGPFITRLTHPSCAIAIGCHPQQSFGYAFGRVWWDQEARLLINDNFRNPAHPGSDHRESFGHSFHKDKPLALIVRGKEKEVGGFQQFSDIFTPTQEMDVPEDSKFFT